MEMKVIDKALLGFRCCYEDADRGGESCEECPYVAGGEGCTRDLYDDVVRVLEWIRTHPDVLMAMGTRIERRECGEL